MKPRHSAYFLIKFTTDFVVVGWRWRVFNPHLSKMGLGLSLKKLPVGDQKIFLNDSIKAEAVSRFPYLTNCCTDLLDGIS